MRIRFKEFVEQTLADMKKQISDEFADMNKSLSLIKNKLQKMGKVNDEMLSMLKDMDTETTEISEKLDELTSQAESNLPPETVEGYRALSARLKGLGKDPTNPIPEPTPTPEPTPGSPA